MRLCLIVFCPTDSSRPSTASEAACREGSGLLHLDSIHARPKVQGAHGLLKSCPSRLPSTPCSVSSTWLPQGFSWSSIRVLESPPKESSQRDYQPNCESNSKRSPEGSASALSSGTACGPASAPGREVVEDSVHVGGRGSLGLPGPRSDDVTQ